MICPGARLLLRGGNSTNTANAGLAYGNWNNGLTNSNGNYGSRPAEMPFDIKTHPVMGFATDNKVNGLHPATPGIGSLNSEDTRQGNAQGAEKTA